MTSRTTTLDHYQRRFRRLIDYIFDHLDDRLDLYTLADVACISPYHLHRLYRCLYGETLADTVRRVRLHYAADALLNSPERPEWIARRAGYGSPQAFSRAFRNAFGMPPAAFRRSGTVASFDLRLTPAQPGSFCVRREHLDPISVTGVRHQGDYLDIGRSFERLLVTLGTRGRAASPPRLCGLYWDDPDTVPTDQLRSLAGAVDLDGPVDGLDRHTLPAGDYAILRFTGPYNHLHRAYQWLFRDWLPASGCLPGDAPVLEDYRNNPREVPPSDLVTDIHLPLQPMPETAEVQSDR